jgi:hypothetical protein
MNVEEDEEHGTDSSFTNKFSRPAYEGCDAAPGLSNVHVCMCHPLASFSIDSSPLIRGS